MLKFTIKDKIKHFFVSYFLFIIFYLILNDLSKSFLVVFLIGFLKEIYDLLTEKNRILDSLPDLAADLLGILLAVLVTYVIIV